MSGIFEKTLDAYGVTLCVARGYDGWDSIHNATVRYQVAKPTTILYFGDFDPSGEDMVRSLRERLDCAPERIKCALTAADIRQYNLPPDYTKPTDSHRKAFVEKHGDVSVELDALPIDILRTRLVTEVEARMDMAALETVRETEDAERELLVELLSEAQ